MEPHTLLGEMMALLSHPRFRLLAPLMLAIPMSLTAQTKIASADFGAMPRGERVRIFTLKNSRGVQARITNYGGIVVSLEAPDRGGRMADIVLGFDTLEEYIANPGPYLGALIGRYGNRIGRARFSLNGEMFRLAANNGPNTLHGGIRGFDKVVWTPRELPDGGLELSYLSKNGEEGFPGDLQVTVVYRLTSANELRIEYRATTNRDTVVNLTNHAYFNLKGHGSGDILDHRLTLIASRFTPVDATLIPTGELRPVAGTPFDFRKATAIGAHINDGDEQMKFGGGYDHNFVLDGSGFRLVARAEEPSSGRVLEVETDQPGVQFYTGNGLRIMHGKGGKAYNPRGAFCLETQHFPDSPNQPAFPSTVLKPGEALRSTTVYRFTTATP